MRNGVLNVWPAFDGLDGQFILHNNKLRFDVAHGRYRNFALRDVTGVIDDTGTPGTNLVIAGSGRGPLADLIDYVNRSSLGTMSRHVGDKVSAQGPATLALTLTIPRIPHPPVHAEGTIGFLGNQLAFDHAPPLSNLTGLLRFSNRTVATNRLSARFLGGDVRAGGNLRENGRYAFDLNGDVSADAARNLGLRGPAATLLTRVDGHAPYRLSVRGARGGLPEVSASADLAALALDLPAPFGKKAGEPMPFALSLRPQAEGRTGAGPRVQHAALTLGPLAANYLLRPMPGGQLPEVVRGAIGLNRPADLPSDGVVAAADLPAFDADAWRRLFQQLRPAPAKAPAGAGSAAQAGGSAAGDVGASRPANGAGVRQASEALVTSSSASTAATSASDSGSAASTGATLSASESESASRSAPASVSASSAGARPSTSPAAPASASPAPPSALASALLPYLPTRAAAHVGTLTLLKRHWEDVVVGATRSGNEWQANVASNQVSGHLSWKPGPVRGAPGTIEARLARLVLPAATENDLLGQAISQPVQNMPAIDLVVNQLIVHDHDLGRLQVNAHNLEEDGVPVWRLDMLELSNPDARLTATANWRTIDESGTDEHEPTAPRRTAVDFRLDVKDAGALLERAGVHNMLKGGEGVLYGDVDWRGAPNLIDYPTLTGNLAIDMRNGQILRVNPVAARLLSLVSLQSIARFPTTDFRGVLDQGLHFSQMTSAVRIHNGVARTDDFRVVTAPARASASGEVDLVQRTLGLHVHVAPTISAGAAVVAVAIVNPLLGLGALAADFALSHSIEAAFALDYSVTGTWTHPVVERVHHDQGKMTTQAPAVAQ
jgi:uncharacterized protein YhdP